MLDALKNNWVEIMALIGGVHAVAKVIVSWTPTQKDDKILSNIVNFVLKVVKIVGLQPEKKS